MNEYIKKRIIAEKCIAPIIQKNRQTTQSGIYLYERTDENGVVFFYCGQAKNVYERQIGHWNGYQRIDLSIRKRGFKSADNPYGWTFKVLEYCTDLDEKEQHYILQNIKQGKQTYNLTYGSQGQGKAGVVEGKTPKGYYDGLHQGYLNARRDVAKLFKANLIVQINGKEGVRKQKALEKFLDFINVGEERNETEETDNQQNG